ncbi:uncharacterized protein LOC112170762 [Rosa chinensis]|uniref:uncharacterized protein LOC112170762 n=1 Tax=Rosa chinensis TaxID=74649 RepID=UPI000D0907E1|nr:uncharacterized protein LOC112170762 [Rosa chinensis]
MAVCPWAFLGGLDMASAPPPTAPKSRTFASILANSTEAAISLSQLPSPVVRGDKIYVKINESLYQEQLKQFKTNLIGRLLLHKGSKPLKADALKGLLAALWQPSKPWRLVPLGKGYFDIHFATEEDLRRVWSGGTCTLPDGIFRLTQWKPDFVPGDTFPQTHAQIWVRIYGLSQDYWHQQHLMEIARGVGTPLQIDKATRERQFGYFARVLIDVDLAGDLPPTLMVERETHCFPIEVVYENVCTHCGRVGHMVDQCRFLKSSNKEQNAQEQKVVKKPSRIGRQEYRPKTAVNNVSEQNLDTTPQVQHSPEVANHDQITKFAEDVLTEAVDQELDCIADLVINEPIVNKMPESCKGNMTPLINKNKIAILASKETEAVVDIIPNEFALVVGTTILEDPTVHITDEDDEVDSDNEMCDDEVNSNMEQKISSAQPTNPLSSHSGQSWHDMVEEENLIDLVDLPTGAPPGFEHVATLAKDVSLITGQGVNENTENGFTPVLSKSQQKKQRRQATQALARETPYPKRDRTKNKKYNQ